MENKIYGVQISADYEGGGVVALFSSFEKAKEYADNSQLSCVESIVIVSMIIDQPDEIEDCGYRRRGK